MTKKISQILVSKEVTSGIQATFHLVLLRVVIWSRLWQSQWKTLTQPCRYFILLLDAWLTWMQHCRVCTLHSPGVLQLWFSVHSKISPSAALGPCPFTADRLPGWSPWGCQLNLQQAAYSCTSQPSPDRIFWFIQAPFLFSQLNSTSVRAHSTLLLTEWDSVREIANVTCNVIFWGGYGRIWQSLF